MENKDKALGTEKAEETVGDKAPDNTIDLPKDKPGDDKIKPIEPGIKLLAAKQELCKQIAREIMEFEQATGCAVAEQVRILHNVKIRDRDFAIYVDLNALI